VISRLAERHGRTPAQLVLRWHIELGNVVIPKSVTPQRIEENLAVFDFELTAGDVREIAGLDAGHRIGPDPDVLGEKPSGFSTKIDPSIH
jgi:diketogulonate reductase-like aldo/keto reductase